MTRTPKPGKRLRAMLALKAMWGSEAQQGDAEDTRKPTVYPARPDFTVELKALRKDVAVRLSKTRAYLAK